MLHKCNLDEVSDGRVYKLNDMVRVGCDDCSGCSYCCHEMCSTIVLDPYDIYMLQLATGDSFEMQLKGRIELTVHEGLIMPQLAIDSSTGACTFLDINGRCSIHKLRPGICRLFPLGRIYTDSGVSYILQVHECIRGGKVKEKVSRWIGIEEAEQYEEYVLKHHTLQKQIASLIPQLTEEQVKGINMLMLQTLYVNSYDLSKGFYEQYAERSNFVMTYIR